MEVVGYIVGILFVVWAVARVATCLIEKAAARSDKKWREKALKEEQP